MVDGYEPHDHIWYAVVQGPLPPVLVGTGEGVPGVWDRVGTGEGYTGTQPRPSQDPYLVLIQPQGPTYGQMKVKKSILMRFPRMGLEWVQKRSRIDLRLTLQTTSQTGPQMALR